MVGILLTAPEELSRAEAVGVRADWFTDGSLGAVYGVLQDRHARRLSLDSISVLNQLKVNPAFNGTAAGLIARLESEAPPAVALAENLDNLGTAHRRRVALRALQGGQVSLERGESPEVLLRDLSAAIGAMCPARNRFAVDPIDATAILSREIPAHICAVEGLLRMKDKVWIAGSSKSRKTWFGLELAVSVAAGLEFVGFNCTQKRVLYLNLELDRDTFERRLQAVCRARGISELPPGAMTVLHLRGRMLDTAQGNIRAIEQAVIAAGAELVILDPFYKLIAGKDENSAGDMVELANALDRIPVNTGCCLSVMDHFPKGSMVSRSHIDRVVGSGGKGRDADSIITLTPHDEPDCLTLEVTHRGLEPVSPCVVAWEYPIFRLRQDLDPNALKRPGRKQKYDPLKLLALIKDGEMNHTDWAAAAKVSVDTLRDYTSEMRRKGWIQTVGGGSTSRQKITEEGLNVLKE